MGERASGRRGLAGCGGGGGGGSRQCDKCDSIGIIVERLRLKPNSEDILKIVMLAICDDL